MDATRARLGSLLEWLIAVGCIVAILAIGSVVVRDFRTVSALTPVIAHEDVAPDPPASVPSRSVLVPVLVLSDGTAVHVGDPASDLSRLIAAGAEVAPATIDRTPDGDRVTRFFAHSGQRFAVVLERLGGDGQARVAAIYVPSSR